MKKRTTLPQTTAALKYSITTFLSATMLSLFAAPAHASDQDIANKLEEALAAIQALQLEVAALKEQQSAAEIAPVLIQPDPSTRPVDNELLQRVEELEDIAFDVDEKVGSRAVVNAFDAASFDVGGFFDGALSAAFGEDSSEVSFNRQVFELLIKADLGNKWDIFVAQAFVRNAPLTFTDADGRRDPTFNNNNSPVVTDTVIARAQYSHSDAFNLQFGRFVTPAGIINMEHFPATLLDPEQPQFLRPFPGQTIFANFTNGVNVHGSKFIGENNANKLSYSAWGGVWAGNSTSAAFGGRLAYSIGNSGLTLGLNATSGDRSRNQQDDRFYVTGGDVLFDKGRWLWKSEVFYSSEDSGEDRYAFYTQPAYRIKPNLTAFYRYDYLDTGSLDGATQEHVGGISFNPTENVRLRGIYRHRRFDETALIPSASANIFQLSTTFNF